MIWIYFVVAKASYLDEKHLSDKNVFVKITDFLDTL